MKLIDFSQTGGYRLKQSTFEKMQSAYYEILKAFITYLQIPDTGNYIISGCTISGTDITSGIMYIDGELCPFVSVTGTLTTKIKKQIITEVLSFKNGSNLPVFRTTNAIVDASGVELQNFVRVPDVPVLPDNIVIDANYVHTDNNFTAALLSKLNGIEAGAEVNVQPDWNVVNPLSKAFIKNKPNFLKVLYKQTAIIGDITNSDFTISFPSLGTDNYAVYPSFETSPTNANQSASYVYIIHSKTDTSFKLRMWETGNNTQYIVMNYLIVEN